jgi:hypothetical protein
MIFSREGPNPQVRILKDYFCIRTCGDAVFLAQTPWIALDINLYPLDIAWRFLDIK